MAAGLAHLAEGDTLGKPGVFFLGQACLDYPVAVGRVVSFHGLLTSFLFALYPLTNRRKTGGKAEVFLKNFEKIFSSGASHKKAGLGWQPQQDSHRTK